VKGQAGNKEGEFAEFNFGGNLLSVRD